MYIVTVILGVLLGVLGIAGYVGTGSEHPTALIPAYFGIVFIILGLVASKENLRKHAMHAAAALALVGFAATASSIPAGVRLASGADVERPPAVIAKSVMAALCAIFVGLCINSFIAARRRRERSQAQLPGS